MPAADYEPHPIVISSIVLGPELSALTERLAENAHDVWASQRRQEGWVWGSSRDDTSKTHPCLVRYAELPDSEKEYDRRTAVATLKAILACGFRIIPPGQPSKSHDSPS